MTNTSNFKQIITEVDSQPYKLVTSPLILLGNKS